MKLTFAILIVGVVFWAGELTWRQRPQCHGAFSHRRDTYQVNGAEYGVSHPPLCRIMGKWPSVRDTTLLLGPLGSMHATRAVTAAIACVGAMLAFGAAPDRSRRAR